MPDLEITEDHRKRADEGLRRLPLARLLGMEFVDIRLGEAILKLEMRDDLRQPHGVLHGGVTASLIDTAMAFAIRTHLQEQEATATIDLTIHYVRPHTSGTVFCTAKVVRPGKRIITVSADVVNGEGKLVATALSTYTKV